MPQLILGLVMPSCGGQDKLTYMFSAERHSLSAFRPPACWYRANLTAESGKSLWKAENVYVGLPRPYAFICLPLDHPSAICF